MREFEDDRKHFSDVSTVIDYTFIKNHWRGLSLETNYEPDHNLSRNYRFFLSTTVVVGFRTINFPDTIILRVIRHIDVEHFFVQKQDPWEDTVFRCFSRFLTFRIDSFVRTVLGGWFYMYRGMLKVSRILSHHHSMVERAHHYCSTWKVWAFACLSFSFSRMTSFQSNATKLTRFCRESEEDSLKKTNSSRTNENSWKHSR